MTAEQRYWEWEARRQEDRQADADRPTAPLIEPPPLFVTGQLVATPGAIEALRRNGTEPIQLVERHVRADFGAVDQEDKNENWHAIRHALRILSEYPLTDGTTVWVITDSDRLATTILLPEEY